MSTESGVRFRPATLKDLDLLELWDEQPHVIAATSDDEDEETAFGDTEWAVELGLNPDWREHLVAEVEGRPIGFVQIIDPLLEETHYWGECEPNLRAIDIWIGAEGDLGKGYGTQMMTQSIERCFANPLVTAIVIDPLASNTRAHVFYKRMGFVEVGPRRFGEDDCIVFELKRANWARG